MWDVAALITMSWDVVTLPLFIGFDRMPENEITLLMSWWVRIFWSLDIVVSFTTGYYTARDEKVVMDFRDIAKYYAKTWLLMDVMVVASDWIMHFISVLSPNYSRASRVGKLSRGLRILRTVRLLKLLKFRRLIEDVITSESAFVNLTIAKLIIMVLMMSHIGACLWYLVGASSPGGWVEAYNWPDTSLGYHYLTSYHWIIFHLGVGGVTIQPQNSGERVVAILMVLSGIVVFSGFVSSATNSLAQLQQKQAQFNRQVGLFHRFCSHNGIPRRLCKRIMRFLQVEMSQLNKQQADHHGLEILDKLSGPLYAELLYHLHRPNMSKHALLGTVVPREPHVTKRLASLIGTKYLATGDALFERGMEADSMFFVCSGELEYTREGWEPHDVEAGRWFSEPALWVERWHHEGCLRADAGPSRLILITAADFVQEISKAPALWANVTGYALSYLELMNESFTVVSFDIASSHWVMQQCESRRSGRRSITSNRSTTL